MWAKCAIQYDLFGLLMHQSKTMAMGHGRKSFFFFFNYYTIMQKIVQLSKKDCLNYKTDRKFELRSHLKPCSAAAG